MSEVHLETTNLKVELGSIGIINGISLQISQAEAVGIIGPNGSGKTTLFNALSGFVPLAEGEIFLSGHNITKESADSRALHGIARVFQNSGIFRDMTLEENMLVALESRANTFNAVFPWSKSYKQYLQIARQMLAEVKLDSKLKQKASSLSGGQMRLLEITRALAFGAEIFLLDEPTAGVSPRMKDEVVALVKKLTALGKTVLIIEHDINLIQRFCSRILVLDAGKIVMDGPPTEIRESQNLQEIYFGSASSNS